MLLAAVHIITNPTNVELILSITNNLSNEQVFTVYNEVIPLVREITPDLEPHRDAIDGLNPAARKKYEDFLRKSGISLPDPPSFQISNNLLLPTKPTSPLVDPNWRPLK